MDRYFLLLYLLTCFFLFGANISGVIYSNNLNPLSAIEVRIGDKITHTDGNGRFILMDIKPGNHIIYVNNDPREILIHEGNNYYEYMLSDRDGKNKALYNIEKLGLYGLGGYIECFSPYILSSGSIVSIGYSRIKKEGDFSYDTFFYQFYTHILDSFVTSFTLTDSTRVSKWFKNKKTIKSVNYKFKINNWPVAFGGIITEGASSYFLSCSYKLDSEHDLVFNIKSEDGNFRKAAFNLAYLNKVSSNLNLVFEALQKEAKFKVFNIGMIFKYKGNSYFLYFRKDTLDKIQAGGISMDIVF